MRGRFHLVGLFLIAVTAFAEDLGGLQSTVAVDMNGQMGLSGNSGASDRLFPREAEVMFYAPADHLFDGVLSFAAHAEDFSIPTPELHEAWFGSSKLIPRSRFRVGQFFLALGRLNQFHQHDWPFISPPKVHTSVFETFEAAMDRGIEYSYLLPVPIFFELTGGLTNGYTFGHDHLAGSKPQVPTHYLRAATYSGLPWNGGTQVGLNYLGRTGKEGTRLTLFGVDLTAKWKEVKTNRVLVQSEFWFRENTPLGQTAQRSYGLYLYPQYHLGSDMYLGLRLDYYSVLQYDLNNALVTNDEMSVVPTFTCKTSEFAQFRLAYTHTLARQAATTSNSSLLEMQFIFILGAHPAHDF